MGQNYVSDSLNAMDRGYYHQLDTFGSIYHPTALHENNGGAKTTLGPRELGMSNNPFQHQLIALQAKIREGASSVEFQFAGRGKSSSQASTPESYGYEEREAMRQLAEYNDVRTSTHATFQVSGLAGYNQQQGFNRQLQHQVMEEVRRAVDFAAQASTGGAIVVHTGEWDRPMSEQKWAHEDFKREFPDEPAFRAYADEPGKAVMPVVDDRTGQIIGGIRKDQEIFEPKWVRAKDYEKYSKKDLPYKDFNNNTIERYDPDDFVDVDGRRLNPDKTEELFRRLPWWNEKETKFETEKLTWDKLVERTKKYNEEHPGEDLTPQELYARIEIDNEALRAKGQSLFYGRQYDAEMKQYEKYKKALAAANKYGDSLSKDEQWKMMRDLGGDEGKGLFIPPDTRDVREWLNERIQAIERDLRHIHEASASADVQAQTLLERKGRIKTVEEYGLQESGRALGELGIYAMQKNQQMKEHVKQKGGDLSKYSDLYIAPENVFPHEYGSHPDELIKIVEAGREKMARELRDKNIAKSEEEAKELAKKHIKSTLDIGHLNMWKTHMKRKDNETESQFNERFEKWAMGKLDEMHKKGVLGHFHITDNLGFNDEHLTPGQGNAPIRSFVKKMEDLGYRDFIIEPGSFNAATAMGEGWSYLGMLGFKQGATGHFGPRFTDVHWKHAGGYAPPNYIVGAYVPSNEWTLWSGSPLE